MDIVIPKENLSHSASYPRTVAVSGTGTWSASANQIKVCELRNSAEGSIFIKGAQDSAFTEIPVAAFDVLRVDAVEIDMDQTSAGTISALGYKTA